MLHAQIKSVPQLLTPDQKRKRFDMSETNLAMFEVDPDGFIERFLHFQAKRQKQNMFLCTQFATHDNTKGRLRASHPHIFSDAIGHIGNHHIKINHKVDPVQHPLCRVPVVLRKKLLRVAETAA